MLYLKSIKKGNIREKKISQMKNRFSHQKFALLVQLLCFVVISKSIHFTKKIIQVS